MKEKFNENHKTSSLNPATLHCTQLSTLCIKFHPNNCSFDILIKLRNRKVFVNTFKKDFSGQINCSNIYIMRIEWENPSPGFKIELHAISLLWSSKTFVVLSLFRIVKTSTSALCIRKIYHFSSSLRKSPWSWVFRKDECFEIVY